MNLCFGAPREYIERIVACGPGFALHINYHEMIIIHANVATQSDDRYDELAHLAEAMDCLKTRFVCRWRSNEQG